MRSTGKVKVPICDGAQITHSQSLRLVALRHDDSDKPSMIQMKKRQTLSEQDSACRIHACTRNGTFSLSLALSISYSHASFGPRAHSLEAALSSMPHAGQCVPLRRCSPGHESTSRGTRRILSFSRPWQRVYMHCSLMVDEQNAGRRMPRPATLHRDPQGLFCVC